MQKGARQVGQGARDASQVSGESWSCLAANLVQILNSYHKYKAERDVT